MCTKLPKPQFFPLASWLPSFKGKNCIDRWIMRGDYSLDWNRWWSLWSSFATLSNRFFFRHPQWIFNKSQYGMWWSSCPILILFLRPANLVGGILDRISLRIPKGPSWTQGQSIWKPQKSASSPFAGPMQNFLLFPLILFRVLSALCQSHLYFRMEIRLDISRTRFFFSAIYIHAKLHALQWPFWAASTKAATAKNSFNYRVGKQGAKITCDSCQTKCIRFLLSQG